MKKILALVLVLVSSQAFATRARLQSLGNAFHLVDTESEFSSPYHMFSVKDFVSFETGKTAATNTTNGSEAITKFSLNDNSKLLIAIGHKDETVQTQRAFMNANMGGTAFVTEQNPIEVIYGIKGESIWNVGAYYSQMKDKVNNFNEQTTGLRLAASHGDFKWKLNLGLNNKAENTTNGTFNNQPYANLGLRYNVGAEHKFGLDYTMWTAKHDNTAGTEVNSYDYQNIKFQYINTTQADGNDFFYGAGIDSITLKDKVNDTKLTRLAIPLIVGFEYAATETFTWRASIKQTLWAQSKDDQGFANGSVDGAYGAVSEFNGVPNNTVVAMGLGWNLSKQVTIDGSLIGLTGATANQKINQSNMLGLVGATYFF
jgi:hypothetical protein